MEALQSIYAQLREFHFAKDCLRLGSKFAVGKDFVFKFIQS